MKSPMPQPGHLTLLNPGAVSILAVGEGDTKLSFDPKNPAERLRAARIVKDMIRRGYCLLVEVEVNGKKETARALDFREDACEYIIADFDPLIAAQEDSKEPPREPEATEPSPAQAAGAQPTAKRAYRKRAIPAEGARAVAVARSAGG